MIAIPAGELTGMVGAYLSEKTGMTLQPGLYSAMMIVNDKHDFVGGVVFTNFRSTDCEVSCAAETAAAWRPQVMKAVFTYVFNQLGCVRCTSITTKKNKRARDFLAGLGFQLEGNVRLGYDGKIDALIYGLLARECRYLADDSGLTDGQEIRTSSASTARSDSHVASADGAEHRGGDGASELEQDRPAHTAGQSAIRANGYER
jgi:hypothetical protein